MGPEENKRGCYILLGIALAILAIAAWLSFGMQSDPKTNLSAPVVPMSGS